MKITFKIIIVFCFSVFTMGQAYAQDMQDMVQKCAMTAGEDAIYLKDFVVDLQPAEAGSPLPVHRQSLALRKNVTYRFKLCNMDNSEGEAVLRLYENANLILSSYDPATKKEYNTINFVCKKSGFYTVIISMKDGKAGKAVGIMAYVK
jgi:hypothetical protein